MSNRTAIAFAIVLAVACPASAQMVSISGDVPIRDTRDMPTGTGLIFGRAVDAGDRRPVAGTVVTLRLLGSSVVPQASLTDGEGRFVFRDLPKGRFQLYASKGGYVNSNYGKHLADSGRDVSNDWQPLELGENEHKANVLIKMWKLAAITGIVRDERGEPVIGITVRALAATYSGGVRRFSGESIYAGVAATTDDRGVFRFGALIPGDYAVVVPVVTQSFPRSLARLLASAPGTPLPTNMSDSGFASNTWAEGAGFTRQTMEGIGDRFGIDSARKSPVVAGTSKDGRLLLYEMQYYPNATTMGRSSTITLTSGEERTGIDFALRAVPTSNVSGKVTGPDGPVSDLVVNLVRVDTEATTSDAAIAQTVTESDGRFMFLGVPAGEYTVRAQLAPRARPRPAAGGGTSISTGAGNVTISNIGDSLRALPTEPMQWATERIVVGDQDIRDVSMTLRRGGRISGRAEFQGAATPVELSLFSSFYVERADGTQSSNIGLLIGTIDRQGNAATMGQSPGKYFLRVPQSGSGSSEWYFAGAMYNGRDLSVSPIEIGESDIEGVVLMFRNKPGASIAGTVAGDSQPLAFTAAVVVFPTNRAQWSASGRNPRDFKTEGVLESGRYRVSDLPPGEYFVAAIPSSRRDWRDAATLEALSRTAVRVTVADQEAKVQNLTLPRRSGGENTIADEQEVVGGGPWIPDDQVQTPPRDVRPAPPVGTGVISGAVVTGQSQEPVRRATITLAGAALLGTRVTISDDEGRFRFGNLPAGRFTLVADKPPYLESLYGASRPGRPGTPMTLVEGERRDVTLPMTKGGVITGTIRNSRGEPVAGASVQLMSYRMTNGVKRLQNYSNSLFFNLSTDDRGMYRLFGLEPGEYAVAAAVRTGTTTTYETTAEDVRYAESLIKGGAPAPRNGASATAARASKPLVTVPMLYPGTADPTRAQLVPVAAGQEVSGIDFVLEPVAAATIRGTVTPMDTGSAIEIRLVNANPIGYSVMFSNPTALLPIRPDPAGKFVFSGIAPGTYSVVVNTAATTGRGAGANFGPPLYGVIELVVNGEDINGVALTLQPGVTVAGTVSFDGSTQKPALSGVRLSLMPVLTGSQVSVGQVQVTIGDDGTFVMPGVMPGLYTPRAILPAGTNAWIPSVAMLAGKDVLDTGFDVRPGENISGLSITFSDRPGEIAGTLQDASGRPAPDFYIILFPAEKSLWRAGARRIQQVRPGTDGRFVIRNLVSGNYLLAALTDVAPGETSDPSFLEQLVAGAIKLTLAEGEKKTQDIQIKK